MNWEVEQKYRVKDGAAALRALRDWGVELGPPEVQTDQYFNHPSRDFATTDEALRLRQIGEAENRITYKGPKIDLTSKTRQELELSLPTGVNVQQDFRALLMVLGFKPVAVVRKTRRHGFTAWNNCQVEVAFDEVDGLGPFLELEICADDSAVSMAKDALLGLAEKLALGKGERRSYLELLLDKTS